MSDFKRQMDDIKIPENLHQRSLQGIHQAQKEQQKPRNWLPKVVASVVTFAAVGFIVLNAGERDARQQPASMIMGKSQFSPQFYWLLAIALMIVCIFVIRRAMRKGMNQKLGIASCVIMVLMLGNSAFFLQNQLAKPIAVPLVYDFFSGNESHDLQISYMTNKNDRRSVSYLQAGKLTLLAHYYNESQKNDTFYYPLDTLEEGNHQLLRSAYFVGNTEEMQSLIDSDEVYLVLDDGEKIATTLQLNFDSTHGNLLNVSTYMQRGSSDGEQSRTVVMEQDTVFDEVYLPKILEDSVTFEKLVVDKVVYSEKDFPVAVKKGQEVTLFFKINKAPMDINTTVGVRGPNGLLPIGIYRKTTIDVKKLRKELMQHDGS